MLFVIKITSNHSEIAGHLFGPFRSENVAAKILKAHGWLENVNGVKGLWYGKISQYMSVNARIERLDIRNKSELPKWDTRSPQ